jgi:hypothetical protein
MYPQHNNIIFKSEIKKRIDQGSFREMTCEPHNTGYRVRRGLG